MTITKTHHFAVTVLGFLLCFGSITSGRCATTGPQVILRKMIVRYESASSYQDRGVVRVVPGDPSVLAATSGGYLQSVLFQDDTLVSFKTYYARPRMFRFEWTSSFLGTSRESAIWSDGKRAYRWMPTEYPRNEPGFTLYNGADLASYLREARASSGSSIFAVPSLLMGVDYLPFRGMIESMRGASLVREENLEGETCYVIKGNMFEVPWVLWVGKRSHLLRKTRTLYISGSFDVSVNKEMHKTMIVEEIHRHIRINEGIPQRVFRFKPQLHAHDVDLTR